MPSISRFYLIDIAADEYRFEKTIYNVNLTSYQKADVVEGIIQAFADNVDSIIDYMTKESALLEYSVNDLTYELDHSTDDSKNQLLSRILAKKTHLLEKFISWSNEYRQVRPENYNICIADGNAYMVHISLPFNYNYNSQMIAENGICIASTEEDIAHLFDLYYTLGTSNPTYRTQFLELK